MNTLIAESLISPSELQKELGKKAKALRLHKGYKRQTLSDLSQVSPSTIQKFEEAGKINLENFLRIAFALDAISPLKRLFNLPEFSSIDDIEKTKNPLRKRGVK